MGGGVAACRTADVAWIDVDDFVEMRQAFKRVVGGRFGLSPVQFLGHGGGKRVVDQGGFTGARNPGNAHQPAGRDGQVHGFQVVAATALRSEEHTSELQSLMRISYAVFCLKKKKQTNISH